MVPGVCNNVVASMVPWVSMHNESYQGRTFIKGGTIFLDSCYELFLCNLGVLLL